MSSAHLFEELECEQPERQTFFKKLQLIDDWRNILKTGLFITLIVIFSVLLTYFLARKSICETGIATSSTFSTSATLPTPGEDVEKSSFLAAGNYSCAAGFTYINHKCWKLVTGPQNRTDADQACFNHRGSTLFSIRNEQENQSVLEFVKDQLVEKLWTGLICHRYGPTWCTWDVKSGTTVDYDNFAEGSPNNDYGDCIYYMTTGKQAGKWSSGSCNETMSFMCELPATIHDDTCEYNYNNHCYTTYDELKLPIEAQNYCTSLDSNLASIHSANENRFARSLFTPDATIAIGGVAVSNELILWYDGTKTTFINTITFKRGSCLFIGNHFEGHWLGYYCLVNRAVFLCKQNILDLQN